MVSNTTIVRAKWIVKGVSQENVAEIIEDGCIAYNDTGILAVAKFGELLPHHPGASVVHYQNHVLMPGFVNGHHHVGVTPFQLGVRDNALELWWAARIAERDIDAYLDTLYSAFEMVASGITTVQHIHGWMTGSPETVYAASSAILTAYQTIGMRASYCYAVREQNRLVYEDDSSFCRSLPAPLGERLADHLRAQTMSFDEHMSLYGQLREDHQKQQLTRIQLAPANLHWMSDKGLMAMVDSAKRDGVPLHMHLLETAYQREYARRRTGTTAVAHLESLGALGPWMTLGHGVWMSDSDMDRVAHTGTCVCHNCSSNFRLRSGVAPLKGYLKRGVTVGLGLDEAGINDDRDMLQEMRLVLRVHRGPGMDDEDVPNCAEVLKMATEDGARTTAFGSTIGRLEVGRQFDAVAINYDSATYPYQDAAAPVLDAVMHRARTRDVDTVYVGGDAIYSHGRFKYVDRDQVLAEIAAQLSKPRSAAEIARLRLSKDVSPFVKRFYDGYLNRPGGTVTLAGHSRNMMR
ncbi:amidohydrolase family protein [Paraburkholderia sp. BCC1886]|uniref:amidohydrolase family protein n=1 Tax=Paraburkholderia sp. BCC1886 TaxID=2562670 RepID=UPI001184430C|nr:amidohydrolase family protein [Paraburkholderia sp. BCC1886]